MRWVWVLEMESGYLGYGGRGERGFGWFGVGEGGR
jgi:hypothetical protein